MILNIYALNLLMPIGEQKAEIERLRNASSGDLLFTAVHGTNRDKIDTLLARSGVKYNIRVLESDINYYKV